MEKLIYRKFAKDVFLFFLLVSISISLIVWVIQAVNFLDIVTEDGHGLKVYFLYTLLSLPKIFSKILPFIYFISLFYIILKYENDNELIHYVFGNSGQDYQHNYIRKNMSNDVYRTNDNVYFLLNTNTTYWGEKPKAPDSKDMDEN